MTISTHAPRYRTIWISDVHLGTRSCKAEVLLDFLANTRSDQLYLVGDIVDGWRLKRAWYWPQAHNEVLTVLTRKARSGTKVTYVPGNHDQSARDHVDRFGAFEVLRETIHVAADGRRFLVTHGDGHDGAIRYFKWLGKLGGRAYRFAVSLNRPRRPGTAVRATATRLKHRVKKAVRYVDTYEVAMAGVAQERRVDGIICGHVHHAGIRSIGGVLYCNDGDWVESCTALVEDFDGRLSILRWAI